MKPHFLSLIALLFSLYSCTGRSKNADSKPEHSFWHEDKSPEAISKLISTDLLSREITFYPSGDLTAVHYAEVCTAYGALKMAGIKDDSLMIAKISNRYRPLLNEGPVNTANHVDANVFGILPLEIYLQNGDREFLAEGLRLADTQWEDPRPDGLSNQTRFWIDDIWMIGVLQVQAFRATGDTTYLNRAALEINAYLKRLQQPNGLFYHGEDIPFHWGRGNGWVAAGLAVLLEELPESNEHYDSIVAGYKKMMHSLLKYQSEEGMWRQLIDKEESWIETSSSAMFGYAFASGVNSGVLNAKKFTPAYQKTWLALTDYVNKEGQVTDVCVGTGQSKDIQYYLDRPKTTGDFHGQAPVLWFAYELVKGK